MTRKKTTSSRKKKGARLGQHLLTSRDIARAVVAAGDVRPGDTVLEVGPGKGMLTRELLDAGAKVVAIEKDREMVATLRETFAKEIAEGTLTLVEDDARTILNAQCSMLNAPYKVIANIPYYITGELLRLFLTAPVQPSTVALLVQKEVAERIVTKGKGKESILSLSVKVYSVPRYVRTVKAGSFSPPPKVDSAILAIENISRNNFTNEGSDARRREKIFFELLHIGFGQKRKTLLGNLKRGWRAVGAARLEKMWEEFGLAKDVRAEDVPLEKWLELASKLTARGF